MTVIQVDIISDIVCAWCYIASRTLTAAVSLYRKTYPDGKHDTFHITWRPYYLNHTHAYIVSRTSIPKAELAKTKLAGFSDEKIAAMKRRVDTVGQGVGIVFRGGGMVGPTRDAHRLVEWCQRGEVVQMEDVVEGLFAAYHSQERDIADREVLVDVAVGAGLDGDQVRRFLESGELESEVDEEAERNREIVSDGVPVFVIKGGGRLEGAGDVGSLMELFVKAKENDPGIS